MFIFIDKENMIYLFIFNQPKKSTNSVNFTSTVEMMYLDEIGMNIPISFFKKPQDLSVCGEV